MVSRQLVRRESTVPEYDGAESRISETESTSFRNEVRKINWYVVQALCRDDFLRDDFCCRISESYHLHFHLDSQRMINKNVPPREPLRSQKHTMREEQWPRKRTSW